MKTIKNNPILIISAVCLIACISCKKNESTPPSNPGNPVSAFYVSGKIDGVSFKMQENVSNVGNSVGYYLDSNNANGYYIREMSVFSVGRNDQGASFNFSFYVNSSDSTILERKKAVYTGSIPYINYVSSLFPEGIEIVYKDVPENFYSTAWNNKNSGYFTITEYKSVNDVVAAMSFKATFECTLYSLTDSIRITNGAIYGRVISFWPIGI